MSSSRNARGAARGIRGVVSGFFIVLDISLHLVTSINFAFLTHSSVSRSF